MLFNFFLLKQNSIVWMTMRTKDTGSVIVIKIVPKDLDFAKTICLVSLKSGMHANPPPMTPRIQNTTNDTMILLLVSHS